MPVKNKALDIIMISGLSCKCIIGTLPKERSKKQKIKADIALFCNLSKARKSDELDDTADYIEIEKNIVSLIKNSSFFLIERLADAVADKCLESPLVKKVDVEIEKYGVSKSFKKVSVKISKIK